MAVIADGDVNGNGTVDLADAILALLVSAGADSGTNLALESDVDGDEAIGLAEAIFVLQDEAELR